MCGFVDTSAKWSENSISVTRVHPFGRLMRIQNKMMKIKKKLPMHHNNVFFFQFDRTIHVSITLIRFPRRS